MFLWFISPWEAARRSLEAQQAMAFHFLNLASSQPRDRQEIISDSEQKGGIPVNESITATAEPAMSAPSATTGRRKTMAVPKAMEATRTPLGNKKRSYRKVKRKGSRPEGKARRGRG